MALPKIDLPTYELTVPSTGKTIRVRPFSVKEEKLLLMAAESDKADEVINTVKQIINNCVVDGEFNVNKAAFFDVDYLFIFLRAKSIGEAVDIVLTCNNIVDGEKCGNKIDTVLDIANVEVISDPDLKNTMMLDKDKGVKMKYPNYSVVKHLEEGNVIDKKVRLITESIDNIFDKNGVYAAKDHTKEELVEFVEGLSEENFKKLERYVDNFPNFAARIQAKCDKCGFEHDVRYSDFYDFFF